MDHIVKLLEDEVEKRVNERLTQMLEKISVTYDISMRQLLRDVTTIDAQPKQTTCRGLTARGKQCRHAAKEDGYCHQHVKQKPVRRIPPTNTTTSTTPAPVVAHTHTLPPLFLAGCPACQRNRQSSDNLMFCV